MASSESNWIIRLRRRFFPWRYKIGPCGNWHHVRDSWCWCRVHEHEGDIWHGGIYHFLTGREYVLETDAAQFREFCVKKAAESAKGKK